MAHALVRYVWRGQQIARVARLTTTPGAFARAELRHAPGLATYALKDGGQHFVIHHDGIDIGIVDEVFGLGWYDVPPAVDAALRSLGGPLRVADVGAHVGLFGVFALRRFPDARITSWEPDPINREALVRTVEANRADATWTVVDAAAATQDGSVRFAGGESSSSKRVESGGSEVPAVDVLPALAAADLIKLDIEGGEWEILGDPRFRELRPAAIVLEWHDYLCPQPDARAHAESILRSMGYTTIPINDMGAAGMLWAVSAR